MNEDFENEVWDMVRENNLWDLKLDAVHEDDCKGHLTGQYVRIENWSGIAFIVDKDNGSETIETHMVGDDKTHIFNREDVTPLNEDAFCSECGQIGCLWGKE